MMSDFGFLTMAYGEEKFVRQAENLALSLRRHMPGIPVAIVTDRKISRTLFDMVVPMKPFRYAGTVYKVGLYEYSPFQETLFIDSDCIVTRPFQQELTAIRKYDFTPIVWGYMYRGESYRRLWDLTAALDRINGKSFPKFNGGLYFFKKGSLARRVFSRANELQNEAANLGIREWDRAGTGDEPLIGLTLAELHVSPLYDDHGGLMRTTKNMIGKLQIDALGGGCSFNKDGVVVTPAICHFYGEWVLSWEYKIAEYSLRNGRAPQLHWRLYCYLDALYCRLYWRLAGMLFRTSPTLYRLLRALYRPLRAFLFPEWRRPAVSISEK
jgi:hypothetical protein